MPDDCSSFTYAMARWWGGLQKAKYQGLSPTIRIPDRPHESLPVVRVWMNQTTILAVAIRVTCSRISADVGRRPLLLQDAGKQQHDRQSGG